MAIGISKRKCLVSMILIGIAGANGCGPNDREINAFMHHWEASVSGTEYVVQPPDVIEIASPHAPEIDGEIQPLRHDGKISLRLLGQVKVAGHTTTEISRKLEFLLNRYYKRPTVSVRVVERLSKRFFVFGEVNRPGPYNCTGRDTVLRVLAEAQPMFTAWKNQIKVIHPSHEDGKRHVLTVDADKIMQEGNLALNVHLEEGDIMYVPPTPLAWIGMRFREVLMPIQPAAQTIVAPGYTGDELDRYYSNGTR